MSAMEELEIAVLRAILAGEGLPCDLPTSPGQYGSFVESRILTGLGFMTSYIRHPRTIVSTTGDSRGVGDVVVVLNGGVEAGFVLMIGSGRLEWLEGYVFGDDRWPDEVVAFRVL